MSEYLDTLASYVPSWVLARSTRETHACSEHFEAVVLFADISGFTPLTERFAAAGPEGVEEFTRILNDYFGQAIELLAEHGFEATKFAGDALLSVAIYTGSSECSTMLARHADAALALQRALHGYQAGADVVLSMKICLGIGPLVGRFLGGLSKRWEFTIAGEPLSQVGRADKHARPGDIVLSPQARLCLGTKAWGDTLEAGHLRLLGVKDFQRGQALPLPVPDPGTESVLEGFVPATVRSGLRAGHADWLGELRQISVLFVNLPDLHADTPLNTAQEMFTSLQSALYRYDGSVNKLSVDDKGVSLLAVFGLPPRSHEDDAERAVLAALAMSHNIQEAGLRCSIGITTGRVIATAVGNKRRREYTIMGNVANLAARLMQAANGGVLCDEPTWRQARDRLRFAELGPIRVKGRSEAIPIYQPLPQSESRDDTGPRSDQGSLVGRVEQMHALRSALRDWLANPDAKPTPLVLEGEAGIGKSRLLRELAAQGRALGARVVRGGGDPIDADTPYHGWARIFATLLHGGSDHEAVVQALTNDQELHNLAPLLEVVLPSNWGDNDTTAKLQGAERARAIQRLLIGILREAAGQQPLLLILDDGQWMDPASWELLLAMHRELPQVLIALAIRDGTQPAEPVAQWLAQSVPQRITLGPLPKDEILELARDRLGLNQLPPQTERIILEKAGGNPMYCEELARGLPTATDIAGILDYLQKAEVPDSVQGLITARLDRLPSEAQFTLKVASVLGRVFGLDELNAVHPKHPAQGYLDGMCRSRLAPDLKPTGAHSPGPVGVSGHYRFRNPLTLDVAYGLMLFAQRRQLHRQAAEWLEERLDEGHVSTYALLAHHRAGAASGNSPEAQALVKAVSYSELAADAALRDFANREAVSFLQRALDLLSRQAESPERDADELRLLLKLGGPLVTIYSYAEPRVANAYRRARELCDHLGDHSRLFDTLRGLWQFHIGDSDYDNAASLARTLLEIAEADGDLDRRAEANRALGNTVFWTGDLQTARKAMENAVALAAQSTSADRTDEYGQNPDVANHGMLAWTVCLSGYPKDAIRHAGLSLQLAQTSGHPFSLAFACGVHMWMYRLLDDGIQTLGWADRTLELTEANGFPYFSTAARVLRGWGRARNGEGKAGLEEALSAVTAWQEMGQEIGVPVFLYATADAAQLAGDSQQALTLLRHPTLTARTHKERWYLADLRRIEGECHWQSGGRESALLAWREALQVAREQSARLIAYRVAHMARNYGLRDDEIGLRKADLEIPQPITNPHFD